MRWLVAFLIVAAPLGFPQAQPNTKQKKSVRPTAAAPAESPEHAFARSHFELLKREFAASQVKYEERMQENPGCEVFPLLIRHPVTTVASVYDYTVGCNYSTREARFTIDSLGEALEQIESQLRYVDACLKTYRNTIDKKISDQTTREVEQIKACQMEDLYPPRTK